MKSTAFTSLHFQHPFWRYQQMILDVVGQQAETDRKYHIVAPPGSGKTIVGLELIRRFGRPAVVFAPTTTIQRQWQEKVELFTGDPEWITSHTSLDARQLADVSILTYQVLSTPGENLEFVERIAVERWVDDLLLGGQAQTEEDAHQRIAALHKANPRAFRREISKRYRQIKREFLRHGEFDGRQFLHPNARDLIDRIVALGAGTLVLDECHHLLDYWAFILRELIKAVPYVRVIGLTATLPDPKNASEYENYVSLLGDVDFEIPTPAVVKEGNLAPYRDLVYFCEPSRREHLYLDRIQEHFEAAVQRITGTEAFREWLWSTLVERRPDGVDSAEPPESFELLFSREPFLCVAGVKFLLAQGHDLSSEIPVVEEMHDEMAIDDWLTLLEAFGLRVLKVSPDPEHQTLYRELRDALLPFGITITERGVRHRRSPGDLVLALSESKDEATIEILRAESRALGSKLRAVIITDFERMSAKTRRLKGVLDPDAGSAVRVFRRLIADPDTNELDPVLVTGKVVLVDADNEERLDTGIRRWSGENRAAFAWEFLPTKDPRILQLTGSGKGWSSRTYVALVTDLFEQGVTRCLVGTRGLFGEGWDALTLNTLINLASVTTSTGVRQLRGRSLRLDPNWPRKVAHNWDVVCYSRRFDKGDSDVGRFVDRHAHTWGIVVRSPDKDLGTAVAAAVDGVLPGMSLQGQVVRGVGHVDTELAFDLCRHEFKRVRFEKYTNRMLAAIQQRERVYDLWKVGEPYSNFSYSATQLEPKDIKFRTAYTIESSLRAMAWRLLVSILAIAGWVWFEGAIRVAFAAPSASVLILGLIALTGLAVLVAVAWNARGIWQVFRRAFIELPADAVLLDIGRALLAALRDAGLVSRHLNDNYVRVVETANGGLEVFLDYASPEDSDTFSRAYRDLMGPIGDARYVIERDVNSLRSLIYGPLWLLVRTVVGLSEDLWAYHRVPDALATRKRRAESLARYWRHYVGGGRLIYTRTAEGRRILLRARAKRRQRIRQMAFEVWK